jgi:RHS repeat-associated protein
LGKLTEFLAYGYADAFLGDYSELVYLRARQYAPSTGRFLSRDTWSGDYNRPLSLNHWNYVEANPANYIDPTGEFPLCPPFTSELECLNFYGMIPDYKGLVTVELYQLMYNSFGRAAGDITSTGLHPTTIAAAIAIQSEWMDYPIDRIKNALYELSRTNCLPEVLNNTLRDKLKGSGFGFAKTNEKFGDPMIMSNSIKAMTERIKNNLKYCLKDCAEKDKLIGSAMAQNAGFVMDHFTFDPYQENPGLKPIRYDWGKYFSSLQTLIVTNGRLTDPINDFRALWRVNYDTRYQLQLFTQDMLVLHSVLGWDLPSDIPTSDLGSMMNLALFGRE